MAENGTTAVQSAAENAPVLMNINDINAVLHGQIRALVSGQTTPANVNAVCNATGKILSTVKLQMEYARLTGKTPDIALLEARVAA